MVTAAAPLLTRRPPPPPSSTWFSLLNGRARASPAVAVHPATAARAPDQSRTGTTAPGATTGAAAGAPLLSSPARCAGCDQLIDRRRRRRSMGERAEGGLPPAGWPRPDKGSWPARFCCPEPRLLFCRTPGILFRICTLVHCIKFYMMKTD